MKKITLLFILSFIMTLGLKAQVVSTICGSTANEADAEWSGVNFSQFELEVELDRGKIRTKAGGLATANYTGTYSGTLSSTDVIYLKIKRQTIRVLPAVPIENFIVKYKQNGGAEESTTLILSNSTTAIEEITVTPGFTDGATLSDLSFTLTQADGTSPSFDIFFPYEFVIGPNPTLSLKSNVIEGASVIGENGEITVAGAQLDAVYAITGQKVKATGLSSGIYIVKISKDSKEATVKIAL